MSGRKRSRGYRRGRKKKNGGTGWILFLKLLLIVCMGVVAFCVFLGDEAKQLLPSGVAEKVAQAEQVISTVIPTGESGKEAAPVQNTSATPSEPYADTAGENLLEEQPVVLDSGEVSVVVESLERNDSGFRIIIALTNERGEDVTWTLDSVSFDGMNVPVGDSCAVPAGKTIRYGYSVSGFLVDMLAGHGTHEVSVSSTVKNSAGDVIASGSSGTVTLEN